MGVAGLHGVLQGLAGDGSRDADVGAGGGRGDAGSTGVGVGAAHVVRGAARERAPADGVRGAVHIRRCCDGRRRGRRLRHSDGAETRTPVQQMLRR